MKNIYQDSVNAVVNGAKFRVEFESDSFWLGEKRKSIITQGHCDEDAILGVPEVENPWKYVQELYSAYERSVPGERSDSKRFKYFQAVKLDELSDAEMVINPSREVAQVMLELYILLAKIGGQLKWSDLGEEWQDKWFWHPKDSNLVVLKEWIEKRA